VLLNSARRLEEQSIVASSSQCPRLTRPQTCDHKSHVIVDQMIAAGMCGDAQMWDDMICDQQRCRSRRSGSATYLCISWWPADQLVCSSAAYMHTGVLISFPSNLLIIDYSAVNQLVHFSRMSQRCVRCSAPTPLNLSTKLTWCHLTAE